ncbi:MAG: hypothetical protein O3B73_05440 [bacterium]|nr:hypothetical protein [bacterium]
MLRSTDTGSLEALLPKAELRGRRSLGAMLVFKRQMAWQELAPEVRRSFDLDDPAVLRRWERHLGSRIYRIYGYHDSPEAGWEFFALLEFTDLEAWQQSQQYLDTSGFSTYYTWDIVALGRQMG